MAAADRHRWIAWLPLAVALIGALFYVNRILIDDAFISYRFAATFAHEFSLTYLYASNYASTAPVYALLLGFLGMFRVDIPTMGALLGAVAIGGAGVAIADWFAPRSRVAALIAGVLIAASPLSWLVLGMEGNLAVALVLLGFLLSDRRRDGWAAAAFAAATLLRFDALAAAAAWGIWMLLRHRRGAVRLGVAYGLLVAFCWWLMLLLFYTPLFPGTLAAKRAQQTLGISGFFPDSSWLDGAAILARAYSGQTWLYGVLALLALLGFALSLRQRSTHRAPLLLALWAVLHALLYIALGVTPYAWYYLPLWVALSGLAATGAAWLVELSANGQGKRAVTLLLLLLVWGGPIISHGAMIRHLQPGVVETEPTVASKVLPERKAFAYRAAGEWLATQTTNLSTVGVTEVGIMGFYSNGPMVDFLGLLDSGVTAAIERGDLAWALYNRQPFYLVLSERNPLYGFDIYRDLWFQAAYRAVERIPGDGFWGGDLTIYQQIAPPGSDSPGARRDGPTRLDRVANVTFDNRITLIGLNLPAGPWRAGDAVTTTLFWSVDQPSVGNDYRLIFHLIDESGALVTANDIPLVANSYAASEWLAGETYVTLAPIALPPIWETPTELRYELALVNSATGEFATVTGPDGSSLPPLIDSIRARPLDPADDPLTLSSAPDNQGASVSLGGFTLQPRHLFQGETPQLTLQIVECRCPVDLAITLHDPANGNVLWQRHATVSGAGPLSMDIDVEPPLPVSWLPLRLSASQNGQPLVRWDGAGQIVQESLPLSPLFRAP
ncbi:MAG: hypothetical protein H6637_04945 [Ardenticatenales bacterium]|nr:hypothetical protein [Ardenticatenales bacterium]